MAWPWTHPYKRFPQFEHLSEEEGRLAVEKIVGDLQLNLIMEGIAATLIGAAIAFVPLCPAMAFLLSGVPGFAHSATSAGVLVCAAVALGAGYLLGSFHYTKMVRLTIETRLGQDPMLLTRRCSRCDYSLVGLPMKADRMITCPECGQACVVPLPSTAPGATGTRP